MAWIYVAPRLLRVAPIFSPSRCGLIATTRALLTAPAPRTRGVTSLLVVFQRHVRARSIGRPRPGRSAGRRMNSFARALTSTPFGLPRGAQGLMPHHSSAADPDFFRKA